MLDMSLSRKLDNRAKAGTTAGEDAAEGIARKREPPPLSPSARQHSDGEPKLPLPSPLLQPPPPPLYDLFHKESFLKPSILIPGLKRKLNRINDDMLIRVSLVRGSSLKVSHSGGIYGTLTLCLRPHSRRSWRVR